MTKAISANGTNVQWTPLGAATQGHPPVLFQTTNCIWKFHFGYLIISKWRMITSNFCTGKALHGNFEAVISTLIIHSHQQRQYDVSTSSQFSLWSSLIKLLSDKTHNINIYNMNTVRLIHYHSQVFQICFAIFSTHFSHWSIIDFPKIAASHEFFAGKLSFDLGSPWLGLPSSNHICTHSHTLNMGMYGSLLRPTPTIRNDGNHWLGRIRSLFVR